MLVCFGECFEAQQQHWHASPEQQHCMLFACASGCGIKPASSKSVAANSNFRELRVRVIS
jgi:hypothetical protein